MSFFKKYILLTLFVLAVGARLTLLAYSWNSVPTLSGGDEEAYHLLGVNLLRYHTYGNPFEPSYQPEHAITPGYPLLVATVYMMVGVRPHGVLIVQCILDSLTVLLIYAIVLRLKGSQSTALIAGILYAFWPPAWYYAQHFYPEPVLTFIFSIMFWLMIEPVPRRLLYCGVLSALALYIKSTSMLLPAIFGMVLFMQSLSSDTNNKGKKWGIALGQTAVFVFIVIILLAPWLIRNKVVLGRMTFATLVEMNFVTGSGVYTLAEVQGEYIPSVMSPRYAHFYAELVAQAKRENPGWKFIQPPSNYYTLEQIDILARTARHIISAHPVAFLTCHVKGILRGWWLPRRNISWFRIFAGGRNITKESNEGWLIFDKNLFNLSERAVLVYLFLVVCNTALLISTIVGIWKLFPRAPLIISAMIFILLFVMIPPSIYMASDRYNLPVIPLMFVCAAFTVEFKKSYISQRK